MLENLQQNFPQSNIDETDIEYSSDIPNELFSDNEEDRDIEENKAAQIKDNSETNTETEAFIPKKKKKEEKPTVDYNIVTALEQSLIFFLERRKDIDELVPGGAKRVRSLKFNISVKESKPFFTVQIGICEATFNVDNGLKEQGRCFNIDRAVKLWYESGTVCSEMKKFVDSAIAAKKAD